MQGSYYLLHWLPNYISRQENRQLIEKFTVLSSANKVDALWVFSYTVMVCACGFVCNIPGFA